ADLQVYHVGGPHAEFPGYDPGGAEARDQRTAVQSGERICDLGRLCAAGGRSGPAGPGHPRQADAGTVTTPKPEPEQADDVKQEVRKLRRIHSLWSQAMLTGAKVRTSCHE